ncbi:MAG: hypothetical protein LBS42_12045, partial [Tannerella sp.]|nr:hypothetical protein [Tannerella sp.]
MRQIKILCVYILFLFVSLDTSGAGRLISGDGNIPLPSPAQVHWLQKERMMFVCLDPCTWQGREYDNHSYPIEKMYLSALNTDQWCETACLWGAKTILFVAKHTGGFCWWQ